MHRYRICSNFIFVSEFSFIFHIVSDIPLCSKITGLCSTRALGLSLGLVYTNYLAYWIIRHC